MLCLDFSHFQPLDNFQPTIVMSRIRRLKPKVYDHGELFLYHKFLMTHGRGGHPKVLSSAYSTGAKTEPTRVASLSNIFEKRCEFHFCQELYVS